jgi:cytochrome d ubiquinol oxidase subunit II
MSLADVWFVLVGVLLAGYAVLDGFDLGAGTLYPFIARGEDEKRIVRASIGPVWDGNEVWLVTGGGALFAAFPAVYAMAFSGFYLAIMLVLFGLIVRAVSLEFRHRDESWKGLWDFLFFIGSAVPALLLGVAVGNVIRGVPLDEVGDYTGSFLDLLNPFSLMVGLTGLAMFMSHGAAWIALKSEGALEKRARAWRGVLQIAYVVLVVVTSIYGVSAVTRHADNVLERPVGWLAIVVFLAAVGYARWNMRRPEGSLKAFLGSAVSIVALAAIAGIGNYPDIVPARGTPESTSLTVEGASSGDTTLGVMLIITIIGFPLVLAYTTYLYRVFRGKTEAAPGEY